MLLELNNVGKRYGAQQVLCAVDLAVDRGQAMGIVGSNGSGKSTLLRILAGISRPSHGTVTGRPSRGYVPERFPAQQRMKARAYLCHMGRIHGMSSAGARTRADELLERFALVGADSALRELSRGNAQKVGLAQAFLVIPELLVLDEPWSGLDVRAQTVLIEMMRELVAQGSGVVFTDHRPELVRSVASQHYQLCAGTLKTIHTTELPTVHIVLRPPEEGEPVDWSSRPGVLSVVSGDQHVRLTAVVPRREALLLNAIQHGWSVLSVSSSDAQEESR